MRRSKKKEIEIFCRKILSLLKRRKQTLSIAESCTGGYVSKLITDIPGASKVFKGSIISYADDIKVKILKVRERDLKTYGAVSCEIVKQMVCNVRKILDTDWGIAITGIAGPKGGTKTKPVGTVWIAVSGPDNVKTLRFRFQGDREYIRYSAVKEAIRFLYREICAIRAEF
ncbi:MAG: CinA family protein [Candidatus Hydrogenedentota bacterium]